MRTISINAIETPNATEAIQLCDCGPTYKEPRAVTLAGRYFVMEATEADRVAAMGVEFAYLFDHEMPNGEHRLMTVPVN